MTFKGLVISITAASLIAWGGVLLLSSEPLPPETEPEGYVGESVEYIYFMDPMEIRANVQVLDFTKEDPMEIVITIEELEALQESQ